jgi:hypothetical protein
MKSVNSTVRTGDLNGAVCAPSFKDSATPKHLDKIMIHVFHHIKRAVCFLEYTRDLMITLMTCCHDKWVHVTTLWRIFSLRMQERPPDLKNNCEYIEYAVADSRQGVILQLGGWARRWQLLTVKLDMLRNGQTFLRLGLIFGIARAEPDKSCPETRFRLSEKRTSPFESAGVSLQSAGRRLCVHIVSWWRLLSVANTLITVWKCRWKAGRSV